MGSTRCLFDRFPTYAMPCLSLPRTASISHLLLDLLTLNSASRHQFESGACLAQSIFTGFTSVLEVTDILLPVLSVLLCFTTHSFWSRIPSGLGFPLGASSAGNGTSASDPDRSSTFSILADGTQDLAALVGLFATDSVERYATDHTRGSWCAAMASCSLLGILGWVRVMLKLAMGSEACENVGFPTTALRPLFGVSKRDKYPSDDVTEVRYTSGGTERHDYLVYHQGGNAYPW